ncbi:MAG: RnfH family protein [Gammaproteobacteria bacterium]|nr:RnfH family protein [Gammaproteobacteria bacterium]MDH5729341.1 RnfH family protein [Gammaproteobacteria bacterium]
MDKPMITVEVAYALPNEQVIIELKVEQGATVKQAIDLSEITERYSDIELAGKNKVGIFGKISRLDQILREKDRVEIYRPLIADPKEVRRRRAAEGKKMRKGAASENTTNEGDS